MPKRLRAWTTTPAETRIAWITASLCVVVIIVAFLWPQIKPDSASESKSIQTKTAKTIPAPSLAKSPPVISKPATKPVEKPKTAPQAKKRVKVTVTKAIPAKSLASGYYIQLGAFKDSTRAQKLSKKLASTWKTHITSRPNGMLAVWNGPYATFKEASLYREKITSTTKLKGFVVKH